MTSRINPLLNQAKTTSEQSIALDHLKKTIKRTIWQAPLKEPHLFPDIDVLDQTRLPHQVSPVRLSSLADACNAISTMIVRGAPLIGAMSIATCAWARAFISERALNSLHSTISTTLGKRALTRWGP